MSSISSYRGIEALEPRRLLAASPLPRFDHVVVLLEEDHSYNQILRTQTEGALVVWPTEVPPLEQQAPHLRQLASEGASFTNAFSVGHTNLVNYQAIFSGFSPGPHDNPWKKLFDAPNLASELQAAGLTFGGYAESLPRIGFTGPHSGEYTKAHNPWVDFSNVPATDNLPFSRFPHDYRKLPTVSYVVPNEQNNMHSGTVEDADQWFHDNIAPYADWAKHHNSLLIVTWDESHYFNNSIPTIFYGAGVRKGLFSERITQDNILRTLENTYGLTPTGRAGAAMPITDIFAPTRSRIVRLHGRGGSDQPVIRRIRAMPSSPRTTNPPRAALGSGAAMSGG